MTSILNYLSDLIWQDHIWLPKGVYFRDLEDRPGFTYPRPRDLILLPVYGLLLHLIRLLFERYLALPLAAYYNIKEHDAKKKIRKNPRLEEYYKKKSKNPSGKDLVALSKQTEWSVSHIQRWFRRRRNCDRHNMKQKFAEASWRFVLYLFAFTFGMVLLLKSPWFWDNIQCWVGYPRQSMTTDVYIYYMFEGTMYMSLVFSLLRDNKRKDFNEQIIHHFSTLFLIWFSYSANFVRIGTLVMAIHDISDIFLEFAKALVYTKIHQKLADFIFVVFSVVFLVSRLVFFPFWIIHTTLIKSMWLYQPYFGYYFFNVLLIILQLLHIFWAAIILKMAYKMTIHGSIEKDDRSDVEESSTDESEREEEAKSPNHHQNNKKSN